MSELSHQAQAVLDAYRSSHLSINNLTAALRAAADQVVPAPHLPYDSCCDVSAAAIRAELFAIAAELETQTESQISEEENERRFKECLRIIRNTTHEDLVELMGEDFLEEFRRASQR